MRSIIGWSLSFRTLVVGLAAGLVVLGSLQLQNAPVDVLPEFRSPTSRSRPRRSGFRRPRSSS